MDCSELSNPSSSSQMILDDGVILPSQVGDCKFSCSQDREKPQVCQQFYFESDHLALKGNPDYLLLLKTLSVLEAQKVGCVRDLDLLLEARDRAVQDPIPFVQSLQRGEQLNLPGPIKIAEIPHIDWSKYDLDDFNCSERRPPKRASKPSVLQSNCTVKTEVVTSGSSNAKIEKTDDGQVLVRGRIFKNYKPKNFNQPWTVDEQKRLEELLQVFPTQDVEMERWKKIAAQLGNRTPVQVQSRVQKYFLKLHKAGLPIPGRLPPQRNKNRYMKSVKRQNKYAKFSNILTGRKSTFLASVLPKVKMDEFEDDSSDGLFSTNVNGFDSSNSNFDSFEEESVIDQVSSSSSSEDEELPSSLKDTAEYKELKWLVRVRREKELELRHGTTVHKAHRCRGCGQAPILGTCWECKDCKAGGSQLYMCNQCVPNHFTIGIHNKNHKFRPIRKAVDTNNGDVGSNQI